MSLADYSKFSFESCKYPSFQMIFQPFMKKLLVDSWLSLKLAFDVDLDQSWIANYNESLNHSNSTQTFRVIDQPTIHEKKNWSIFLAISRGWWLISSFSRKSLTCVHSFPKWHPVFIIRLFGIEIYYILDWWLRSIRRRQKHDIFYVTSHVLMCVKNFIAGLQLQSLVMVWEQLHQLQPVGGSSISRERTCFLTTLVYSQAAWAFHPLKLTGLLPLSFALLSMVVHDCKKE
jgi:hypothetical protein